MNCNNLKIPPFAEFPNAVKVEVNNRSNPVTNHEPINVPLPNHPHEYEIHVEYSYHVNDELKISIEGYLLLLL